MKIYLIRHGQTTGDVEDRYGGAYDDDLTAKGITQAHKLSQKLANSGIEVLYASPLKRANQTAKILQASLGCQIKTIDNLKERNKNGLLTGMTRAEAKIKYPELVEKLMDYRSQIQGAESQEAFANRITTAFINITKISDYSTIGIVTHGMPFWVIFDDFLGNNTIGAIHDCAYAIISQQGNKFSLIKTDGIEYKNNLLNHPFL